ncbi:MAG: rod shape-determining protein MreC [Candidatus Saccharimonadales bacterium]
MRRLIALSLGVIISLILAVRLLGWPLETVAARLLHPIGQTLHTAGVRLGSAVSELPRVGRLQSTLDEQAREISDLRRQAVSLERLREQNRQLRDELGFLRSHNFDAVPADVVNYQPDSTRNMLRINVGSSDGIEPDMPVISAGVLVGVVQATEERFATVLLLGDTDFRALVEVNGTSGVLRAQIGGVQVVERLPRDQGVQAGDIVTTSGQDGVFPPGLLVGTVSSLAQAPGEVFDTAQLQPELDPRRLQTVTVLRQ